MEDVEGKYIELTTGGDAMKKVGVIRIDDLLLRHLNDCKSGTLLLRLWFACAASIQVEHFASLFSISEQLHSDESACTFFLERVKMLSDQLRPSMILS